MALFRYALIALFSWQIVFSAGVPKKSIHKKPNFHPFLIQKGLVRPPPVNPAKAQAVQELTFAQRLDHFNSADNRTWAQRYFSNDDYYQAGGPAFIFIGGEGEASAGWMTGGQWVAWARQYGAYLFQLEHRFYGVSQPFEDLSTPNLRYLNSEQALADLAYFRESIGEQLSLNDAKWIVFGGSYPGNLAAWFMLKYPHLAVGGVGSSAPVVAQVNFQEYMAVVVDAMNSINDGCVPAVQEATNQLEALLADGSNAQVSSQFQLCETLDASNPKDVATFFASIAANFQSVVQYNFDYSLDQDISTNGFCKIMVDESYGTPLERYAFINSLYLGQFCIDVRYQNMIEYLQDDVWMGSGENYRQWMYQTCTEFGYYQTGDYPGTPFGKTFNTDYYVQQCADIYGAEFDSELVHRSVNETNVVYGGRNPGIRKIVYPNGSLDPWHALGVQQDLNDEATAVLIEGTAHCADMYERGSDDPAPLVAGRDRISAQIDAWLS